MPFQHKRRGAILDGMRRKLRSAMDIAAEEATAEMRRVITSSEVERPTSKGPGRSDTGDMLDAVTRGKVKITATGKSYQVFWGWPLSERKSHSDRMTETNREYLSYFDLQDLGFDHLSAGPIPGMHAVEAGRMKFQEVMRREWRR